MTAGQLEEQEGTLLYKTSCDECGSSDANAIYSSGTSYCFSCNTFKKLNTDGEPEHTSNNTKALGLLAGTAEALLKRHITEETCVKWGYFRGTDIVGKPVQIANYKDTKGKVVAQKLRYADKEFKFIGDTKQASLFGSNLFQSDQYKSRIIIVEGEIDAMSVSQVYSHKWAVVSIATGAASAKKELQRNLEWLNTFDTIVLAFDNDEPGRKATDSCVGLFSPGKVKICTWKYKDANDALVKGEVQSIITDISNAQEYRPDGIVRGTDLWDVISKESSYLSFHLPYPKLDETLKGLRKGELLTFSAGSGIGKSTIVKELAYHLMMTHNLKIGYVALEENLKRSAQNFMSIYLNKPLHLLDEQPPMEELKEAFDETVGNNKVWFYDHFGSLDSDNLLNKLEYLAISCEVDFIVLDHISIVVSGSEDADSNERRAIDKLMTNLRSLVERTGVGMLVVSHLKRPEGKGHEEGARVSLAQLRGSGAIAQLSDSVIGLERDQQGKQPNHVLVRVLKSRFTGQVGACDTLSYNKETGRLLAVGTPGHKEEIFQKQGSTSDDF